MRVIPGKTGTVYLIGAGPGDPELLTIRGLRALRRSEVVVYDRLVDPVLLDEAPPGAERIFVGKRGGHYSFPQSEIHQLMIRSARSGKNVARLKGGDPFLFGRGGEEVLALTEAGIPYEVIPGVSSALAVPAAAGIPVTHRGLATSVSIVTGHGRGDEPIDWGRLARASDTLVVLMPLANLRTIVSQLVLHGRALSTPAAVIQDGTRPGQRQVISTLREIASEVEIAGIESPATLVVGEVVELAQVSSRMKKEGWPDLECGSRASALRK
jgi:uroporphyrin-III C-methyltransferase